jgi:hypothetical protein
VLPIDLLELLFQVCIGGLRVVLDAGQRRAELSRVFRAGDRLEHRRQLLRPSAPRLVSEADQQPADLLPSPLARHWFELPGMHAERQRPELVVQPRHVADRRRDARPHLGAVHEDSSGVRECVLRHAQETLVLLQRVLELTPVWHDRERDAGGFFRPLRDDGHQRGVVRVDCVDSALRNDLVDDSNVAADILLDRIVRKVDHRDRIRELLVLVPDENGQCVAKPWLVHDALAAIRNLPPKQRLDCAIELVDVRLGNTVVELGVGLLTDQMHGLAISAERLHDATRPEVATGAL